MTIENAPKKDAFLPTDRVPVGVDGVKNAYTVNGAQIKKMVDTPSKSNAAASEVSTIRVKLSDNTYGEIQKADLINAIGSTLYGATTLAGLAPKVDALNVQTPLALPTGGVYQSVQLWDGGPEFAKMNVGAKSESDYGDLFAWGATEPYRLDGSTVIDPTGTSGDVWAWYNKSAASKIQHDLYPNEDAAAVHMGKGWRMPTSAELQALVAGASGDGQSANVLYQGTNCNHMWTQVNGVWGRKFIDKRDSNNYLFFPAAGFVHSSSLRSRGGDMYVWSRSRYSSSDGWRLGSVSGGLDVRGYGRGFGFSLRGVRV